MIALTEREKNLYTGSGWKLASFRDGVLVGFFDLDESTTRLDIEIWVANIQGEIWLVMCSCYELCEPQPVFDRQGWNAVGLARVARVLEG